MQIVNRISRAFSSSKSFLLCYHLHTEKTTFQYQAVLMSLLIKLYTVTISRQTICILSSLFIIHTMKSYMYHVPPPPPPPPPPHILKVRGTYNCFYADPVGLEPNLHEYNIGAW